MRIAKVVLLAAAALVALAPAAVADHGHENGCGLDSPVIMGHSTTGDYAGVCTPLGFLVVGADPNQGAYVYADGADGNPEGLQGYLVLGVRADGTHFCSANGAPGQWNHTYSGTQFCVV